jgi:hypothetical protein
MGMLCAALFGVERDARDVVVSGRDYLRRAEASSETPGSCSPSSVA